MWAEATWPSAVEDDGPELSAQQDEGFVLGGIRMAVGLDIGVRAQGVEKPLAGIVVRGVQIEILAPPGHGGGLGGEPVQKSGIENADRGSWEETPSKKTADGKGKSAPFAVRDARSGTQSLRWTYASTLMSLEDCQTPWMLQ